ncbi:MAG: Abi family protein [Lachnospiraceae bacterium]|nr:Abi family protein [Lachnospiraceae bacterium]
MVITSRVDVEKVLKSVGFYRLRGYSFHLYDNVAKKYVPGTKFDDIFQLYQFDQELSALVFAMISKIEEYGNSRKKFLTNHILV